MSSNKFAIVQTVHGPVKGLKTVTHLGRDIFKFSSVPIMKPPVGSLRFRGPEVPDKWTEPLDVTETARHFPSLDFISQQVHGTVNGGVVSVSTPYFERKLPVAVYIQGGGFQMASSVDVAYGPDYLLQKDIVYVALNYRVGPMGFLSLKDPSLAVPGNAGLKDQLLALKWVKNNIAQFGGDPDNITIFGTSAGGVSVHFHMISEQSKGLFHRAMPMSGTASIKTWPIIDKKDLTERLAKALGWDGTGGEKEILRVLESADIERLVIEEGKLLTKEEIYKGHIMFPFTPVVEPYVTATTFVPKDPILMAQDAWSNDIDSMIGGTSLEGVLMFMFNEDYLNHFKKPEDFVPLSILGLDPNNADDKQKIAKYGKKLQKLYFDDNTPSVDTLRQYLLYAGDFAFLHGAYCAVLSRVNSSGEGKTFFYRFDIQTNLNIMKNIFASELDGASHGDDLGYIFKTNFPGMPSPTPTDEEFGLIKKFVATLTSFMITGNPNNDLLETTWEPSTSLPLKCLNMTAENFSMTPFPENDRFKVLDGIFQDANVAVYSDGDAQSRKIRSANGKL